MEGSAFRYVFNKTKNHTKLKDTKEYKVIYKEFTLIKLSSDLALILYLFIFGCST